MANFINKITKGNNSYNINDYRIGELTKAESGKILTIAVKDNEAVIVSSDIPDTGVISVSGQNGISATTIDGAVTAQLNINPNTKAGNVTLTADSNGLSANISRDTLDVFSKEEVKDLIQNVSQFKYEVKTTLPEASASTMGIIYLVKVEGATGQNIYAEYLTLKIDNDYTWEQIGDTEIDLSRYMEKPSSANNGDVLTYVESTGKWEALPKINLVSIGVETIPTQTKYYAGDTLNTAGMVVKAYYGIDNVSLEGKNVEGYEIKYNSGSAFADGDTSVTISYTDGAQTKTTTLSGLTIVKKLQSIAVTTQPSTTTFEYTDTLDTTGIKVTATYSDKSTEVVTCSYSPLKLTTVGTQAITVSYSQEVSGLSTVTKTTTYNVTVNNKVLAIPVQGNTLTYNGSSQSPTWSNYSNPSTYFTFTAPSATAAGTYACWFTPKANYCWADGSVGAEDASWVIGRQSIITIPSPKADLIYTAAAQSPNWDNYSSEKLTIGGTTSATNVGTYTATFTPTSNYQWSDASVTAKSVNWVIKEGTATKPTLTTTSYVYTGNIIEPKFSGYDADKMTATNITGTNVGSYTATFKLKTGYKWSDSTTADVTISWTVTRKSVGDKPTTSVSKVYNTQSQTNEYTKPDGVTEEGNSKGTTVGTYTATYTPDGNHMWSDGTYSAVSVKLTITAATVSVPTITGGGTYKGSAYTVTESGYSTGLMTRSEDSVLSATNAGTYTVKYDLKDTDNYVWSTGGTATYSITWTITRASAGSKPTTLNPSGTYTGSTITNGYTTPTGITMTGSNSGVNAGTYTAKYTPTSNYAWSDGNTNTVTVTLTINKATPAAISLSKTSVTFGPNSTTETITVTRTGDGQISATTTSSSIAGVTVSGTQVIISNTGKTAGTATVTVSVAEGTNYTAPANVTISVSAAFEWTASTSKPSGTASSKTISGMTADELTKAGTAIKKNSAITSTTSTVYVNAGSEYYTINTGDTLTVNTNGTNYQYTLMGFNQYNETSTAYAANSQRSASSGLTGNKSGMLFQMTNCMNSTMVMKSSMTSSDGWHNSDLRATLNGYTLKIGTTAITPTLVELPTAQNVSSSTLYYTSDKIFLPSEYEVFGSKSYALVNEGTQYARYKNGQSKVKTVNSSSNYWWLRSPSYWFSFSGNSYFCCVYSGGTAGNSSASGSFGVAPGFCL